MTKQNKCAQKEGRWTHAFPCTCAGGYQPTHECNVVPAEMHTQMMNERDARLRGRDVEIADLKRLLSEKLVPQPVREGWWLAPVFLMMAFGLGFFLAWSFFRYYPAASKGTVDATPEVNILAMEQNYVKLESDLWKSIRERDHWLRNDQAAYRVSGLR